MNSIKDDCDVQALTKALVNYKAFAMTYSEAFLHFKDQKYPDGSRDDDRL